MPCIEYIVKQQMEFDQQLVHTSTANFHLAIERTRTSYTDITEILQKQNPSKKKKKNTNTNTVKITHWIQKRNLTPPYSQGQK